MPDNGTNGRWCTIFDVAALVPMRRSTEGNKMPPIKSFRRFVLYSPVVDAAQHTHHTNNGWDPWRRCRDKTENQTHDTGTLGLHVSVCLSVSVCVCVCADAIKVSICAARTLLHAGGENDVYFRSHRIHFPFVYRFYICSQLLSTGNGVSVRRRTWTCRTVVSERLKLVRESWQMDQFFHSILLCRFNFTFHISRETGYSADGTASLNFAQQNN